MSTLYFLKNQHGEFLSKGNEWLSEGEIKTRFQTAYKDEVINKKVELTVKHPELRLYVESSESPALADQDTAKTEVPETETPETKDLGLAASENHSPENHSSESNASANDSNESNADEDNTDQNNASEAQASSAPKLIASPASDASAQAALG